MPIFSASPSMVNVQNLMKETFEAAATNNNHLLNNSFLCQGLSEDEYITQLISAVEKRPVLYNVHLLDYKNKNKKGEAFKEVQQVMRNAGCNEQQVQGTYKKWISLKRKFRVEYFKPKTEDSREASCSFPYYEQLKFLIPYCEVYKMCKTASKRKADEFSGNNMDEDESDDERYGLTNYEEDSTGKRVKLDALMNAASNGINPLTNTTSGGSDSADSPPPSAVRSPLPSSQIAASFLQCPAASGSSPTNANGGSSTSSSAVSRRSNNQNATNLTANNNFLSSLPNFFSSNGNQNSDDISSAMAAMANYLAPPPQDDSPNALFGRLVANELDKLDPKFHNVARAQILLLLAQSSQQNSNNATSTTADRLFGCLTP
ncbi:hypothetical protein M3Y97_00209300 [Aphelenchoides bicaudatus]|nr:hypothetical protein M3Y97_00209300 [Aphelenchoides bicaudatus]